MAAPRAGKPWRGVVFEEGCVMSTLLSFRLAAIAVVMVLWGILCLAQELDAKWLAGTWRGTPSPAGAGQLAVIAS